MPNYAEHELTWRSLDRQLVLVYVWAAARLGYNLTFREFRR